MDEDNLIFCDVNGTYCFRAFCEDYGCADALGVPVTSHDRETGCNRDNPPILKSRKKRKADTRQGKLFT